MLDTKVHKHQDRRYPLFVMGIETRNDQFAQTAEDFTPIEVDIQNPAAFKMDIVIEVASDSSGSISYNDNDLVKNRPLPRSGASTFIVQAFRWSEDADITEPVSIELESLTISGSLP
jgi:hypothetical protein